MNWPTLDGRHVVRCPDDGPGAHNDSLAWIFSTQSPDDNAILSQLIDYGLKVQEGTITDPSFKLFLYWTPPDLDPWDEKNWYLANPALGDFKNLESMRDEAQKAQNMPSREASFRNLHLNQRIDAAEHWITPDFVEGLRRRLPTWKIPEGGSGGGALIFPERTTSPPGIGESG